MESYETVEGFERIWPQIPKNIPLISKDRKYVNFNLFLQAETLQVYACLSVGLRGGISESVTVIDPKPRVTADRLVVSDGEGGASNVGLLLPLSDLRRQVRQSRGGRRDLALQLCNDAMWDFLEKLDTQPLRDSALRHLPVSGNSIKAISAGAPSLGRRGGGVSGKS